MARIRRIISYFFGRGKKLPVAIIVTVMVYLTSRLYEVHIPKAHELGKEHRRRSLGHARFTKTFPTISPEKDTCRNVKTNSYLPLNVTKPYTCRNQNHLDIRTAVKTFNNRVAVKLLKNDKGSAVVYEDDDDWHTVSPGILAYSAYLEENSNDSWSIRIVGVARRRRKYEKLSCLVSWEGGEFVSSVSSEHLSEHPAPAYGAYLFRCPVSNLEAIRQDTIKVALGFDLSKKDRTELEWMSVHRPQKPQFKCCTVCVRPLNKYFHELAYVAEFLGYYASMGIRRFDFYMAEVSRELELMFAELQDHPDAVIRLHKWNLPLTLKELEEHGQISALQECVYRSRSATEYVLNIDLDEFFVPRQHRSIAEALETLEATHGRDSVGSYVIKNRFFCTEFPYNPAFLQPDRAPLLTRIINVREAKVWAHNQRSKYIAKGSFTVVAGVHFVWTHSGGKRAIYVNDDMLSLHHYRSCCEVNTGTAEVLSQTNLVVDCAIKTFGDVTERSHAVAFVNSLFDPPKDE